MTPNTEWKNATISLVAAAIFFLICIISIMGIDGMSGGYALAFVSLFLAVGGLVVALLFVTWARARDAILTDPSPVAHWDYPEAMMQETTEREYREFQARNHVMFMVIGGMLGVVALVFLLFVRDGGPETALVLLAIAGLLFVVSRLTPWLEYRRARAAPREAVITHQGVVYCGTVYPFRSFLISYDGAMFYEPQRNKPATITLSFSQLVGQFIIRPFTITIPVPAGEEDTARQVVRNLRGRV
ncbi:MAG: hypothetical protein GX651_00025 [Methanomicrobiales archaeon]|nr:hypothetical protein [Methanomicrobiales archaeon]